MIKDWLYGPERLELRSQSLLLLLLHLGGQTRPDGVSLHSNENIYAAAHDWVSHGNPTTDGILAFYYKYYSQGKFGKSAADSLKSVL